MTPKFLLFATTITLSLLATSALADSYARRVSLKLPHHDTKQWYTLKDGNAFYEPTLQKYGLVDDDGQLLLKPSYDDISHLASLNYYQLEKNHKYGLVNAQGKFIFPPEFDNIHFFAKNRIFVLHKGSQSGLADETGKFIIPLQSTYHYPSELDKHLIVALKQTPSGRQAGIVNASGQFVVPIKYQSIAKTKHHLISIRQNNKWGLIDTKGNMVLAPQYDEIDFLTHNPTLFKVKTKNEYLLINQQNQTMLSGKFTNIQEIAPNVFLVKDGLWRVVNQQGKPLNKSQFHDIKTSNFNDDPIAVQVDNKWEFINRQGNMVIKPKFKEVTPFQKDHMGGYYAHVHESNGKSYDIGINGAPYTPLIVVE